MRNDPPALMLFAAGFGSRMRPLTDTRPKPLIEVAGRPLIDHALALGRAVGAQSIVVNAHYLPDQLEQHLAGTDVTVLREAPDILDTGGGLRNALPHLGAGPVLTMNTDAVWAGPNPVAQLLAQWEPARMDALLTCVPMTHVLGRQGGGDFDIDDQGALHRGSAYVYGGVQILKTDLLHDVAERAFSLNVVWNMMADRGRLYGARYAGRWCDVGHPGGIKEAEEMLAQYHV